MCQNNSHHVRAMLFWKALKEEAETELIKAVKCFFPSLFFPAFKSLESVWDS